MGATYSIFQLIGAPVLGKWSDTYGRRKILLLSQIGTLISWAIFLIALLLPVTRLQEITTPLTGSFFVTLPLLILFASRALDGITGGNVSVANAYLADISDEAHRSENFGKMAASANLGYILGPALAGILSGTVLGEILPVLAAFFISLIATILIAYLLPDTKVRPIDVNLQSSNIRKVMGQEPKECYDIECKEKVTFFGILKQGNVAYVLTIYFLVFLGFNFFYISFPVHAVRSLNWNLVETGFFFSFIGLTMAFIQGPVLKHATRKFTDLKLVIMGSLILSLSFLFFQFESIWLIYSGATMLSIGNGLMWASVLSILSTSSSEKYQGAVQGFAGSAGSIASILGLLVGGILYEHLSADIFIMAALMLFFVFILALKFPDPKKGKAESMKCKHLDKLKSVTPGSEGCAECLKNGDKWIHLRICLECGQVSCCNTSRNKHAMRHFKETGHTLMQSFEQNEYWGWCYEEEMLVNFEKKMY
jgi:MFS family permease